MKKLTVILLVLFFVLSSCSNGQTTSQDQTDNNGTTTERSGEVIELLLMTDAVEGPIAEFYDNELPELWAKDHPDSNIVLKHEAMPFNDLMGAPLQVRYASGNAPDIQLTTVEMTLTLVSAGYLQELDDLYTAAVLDDYFDGIVEGVSTFNGHQYTFMMHRGLVMMAYDLGVLREAGIDPPKTPEDLIAAANEVTTNERYGMTAFIDPSDHLIMTWMPFIWGQGGDALNEDLNAGALDTPEVIRGLSLIRELASSPAFNPLPSRPGNNAGILGDGETVFQFMPFSQCRLLERDYSDRIDDLQVARYPMPEGNPFITFGGGWALGASSASKYPEEAKQAAFWIAVENNDTVKKMVTINGNMPCRRSVLDDPEVAALYEGKMYSMIMNDPEHLNGVRMAYVATSEFNKILIDMLDRALFEHNTPVEVIAAEQNAKMDEYIANYTGPKDGLRRQDLGLSTSD